MEFLWAGLSFVAGVTWTLALLEIIAAFHRPRAQHSIDEVFLDSELEANPEQGYSRLDRWA
jgi:hypothetical protein